MISSSFPKGQIVSCSWLDLTTFFRPTSLSHLLLERWLWVFYHTGLCLPEGFQSHKFFLMLGSRKDLSSLFLPGEFFLALLYFLVAGYPINCPTENSSMPLLKASCFGRRFGRRFGRSFGRRFGGLLSGRRIMVYLLSCIPGQLMFFWCKEVVAILGK